jgi:hypothetical protein
MRNVVITLNFINGLVMYHLILDGVISQTKHSIIEQI